MKSTIQDLGNFWRIEGVKYRNDVSSYDLSKSLLPSMNYKQSIKHAIKSKQTGDFYTPNSILLYSIINSAYEQKNNPIAENIREFIQSSMIDKYLKILSLGQYTPEGKDIMIHNSTMDNKFSIKCDLVGKDGYIQDINSKPYLDAFLGASNIKEINKRFQWLNKTDAYIFRLNEKPSNIEERIAGFDANSVRVGLNCCWSSSNSDSALGVRESAEGAQKILKENYTRNDIKQALKKTNLLGIESILINQLNIKERKK